MLVSRLFANQPGLSSINNDISNISKQSVERASRPIFRWKIGTNDDETSKLPLKFFAFRIFFFSPIFLKTRIIHGGNKSFVFSLSLKKLFKEQLFRISLYIIFRRHFLIVNQEKKKDRKISRSKRKRKSSGNHFSTLFSSNIGVAAPLGLEKDASRWIIEKRIFRLKGTRFFVPPSPSFSFHKSNHHSFLQLPPRFYLFQRCY